MTYYLIPNWLFFCHNNLKYYSDSQATNFRLAPNHIRRNAMLKLLLSLTLMLLLSTAAMANPPPTARPSTRAGHKQVAASELKDLADETKAVLVGPIVRSGICGEFDKGSSAVIRS